MFKEEGFWECERDSPLFNRSGLTSESNLKMILPKFRNLHRISKSLLKLDYITIIHNNSNNNSNIKEENDVKNSKDDNLLNNSVNSSVTVTGPPNSTTTTEVTDTTNNTTNNTTKGTNDIEDDSTKVTTTNSEDSSTEENPNEIAVVTKTGESSTFSDDTNTTIKDTNTVDTNTKEAPFGDKEAPFGAVTKNTEGERDNTKGPLSGVGDTYTVTEELKRIFKLDAERTFKNEKYKEQFYKNLCLVFERLGDYHQGEGFIIALLSIYLNTIEVINVMRVMSNNYLPGYFSSKPRNYVRDSKVLMLLLERRNIKLYQILNDLIVPEAFVSKWFIGLGIHIFDFEAISTLLNYLFEQGQIFLFKLGLSFFMNFSNEILEKPDVSFVLKLLRLDDEVIPKDDYERSKIYYDILMGSFEQDVTELEINELRLKVEKQMKQDDELRELRQKVRVTVLAPADPITY
uniref:Rab-GTPase-TBC domain containing protein, putative n=1 Tax=Theileria annulata TaxID=5874 RepID=A0A3B0MWN5_THEAN